MRPNDVTVFVDMTGVDLTEANSFFLMIRRPPRCTLSSSSAASDVYKRQVTVNIAQGDHEYKYALGAWVSQESVPADCVNTLGANRAVTVTADVTLDTDVYNGCPGDDTSGGDTGGTDPVLATTPGLTDAAHSGLSPFRGAFSN